ncbi:hypothetical protein ACUXF8_004208 [Pantoea piersonii]
MAPEFSRRTTEGMASKKAFLDDCASPGVTVLDVAQGRKLRQMRDSALAHPAACWLPETDGHSEVSMYWTEDETGERCHIWPDKFLTRQPVMVDVKKDTVNRQVNSGKRV